MPRPERPVEGSGPLQHLARELRRTRNEAGTPRPTYCELAARTEFSAETLSLAARGTSRPTWRVTKAFADACDPTGDASRRLRPLWEAASAPVGKAASRLRPTARPSHANPVDPAGRRPASRPQPGPSGTCSQADYVRRLRALRTQAGPPGPGEQRLGTWGSVPRSTLSDVFRRPARRAGARTVLPRRKTVKRILRECLGNADELNAWLAEWDALMRPIKQEVREAYKVREQWRKKRQSKGGRAAAGAGPGTPGRLDGLISPGAAGSSGLPAESVGRHKQKNKTIKNGAKAGA